MSTFCGTTVNTSGTILYSINDFSISLDVAFGDGAIVNSKTQINESYKIFVTICFLVTTSIIARAVFVNLKSKELVN